MNLSPDPAANSGRFASAGMRGGHYRKVGCRSRWTPSGCTATVPFQPEKAGREGRRKAGAVKVKREPDAPNGAKRSRPGRNSCLPGGAGHGWGVDGMRTAESRDTMNQKL